MVGFRRRNGGLKTKRASRFGLLAVTFNALLIKVCSLDAMRSVDPVLEESKAMRIVNNLSVDSVIH